MMPDIPAQPVGGGIQAHLGPTNTGKTHRAVERMLSHASGMIGLPLRLLAREVYDRITARVGENAVALVTGEEKRVPRRPRYWVCTVEAMPVSLDVDFVAVDEVQLVAHRQRGHTFTERLLHARGRLETWFLGAETVRPLLEELLPTATVHRDPRLSRLSHGGSWSLGSLPARTAVVAFSVEEVYEIAERLRQRHGGTAVVLGALSPRTRNAQVAMYQSGEVQHLVATDAIGMGLNLDVDRVVFASLHKFDGKESRTLEASELAQIAGRAGRYTRDGAFGTLRAWHGARSRPMDLHPRVVTAIESHTFAPVQHAVWRNIELDFTSVDALVESLKRRSGHPRLRLVEASDDFEALMQLARREDVRARAVGVEAVELLWDVCRIPDFRKLLLDSHVQLLGMVYAQLSGPSGRIDPDWMARRIARLDDSDGDIETLMRRIAFIRTWTYITNHDRWVHDAEHWRARTREIEDRHSDALHRRLTERFVDPRATVTARPSSRGRTRTKRLEPRLEVAPDSPFRQLLELELPDAVQADQPDEDEQWVQAIVDAPFAAFAVEGQSIVHAPRGRPGTEPIALLRRGADLLHPEVALVSSLRALAAGQQARVLRRVVAWSRDAVADLLDPLERIDRDALEAAGRGLVYQLEQGLGTVDGRAAGAQLASLSAADRARLAAAGVVVGRSSLYLPRACKARAIALRSALWSAHREPPCTPRPPPAGALSVEPCADVHASFYPHVGYLVRGPLAIRVDRLERALAWLDSDAAVQSPAVPVLGPLLGCSRRKLPGVLGALGHRLDEEGRARPSRKAGRRRRRPRRGLEPSESPRTGQGSGVRSAR